jgi:hypothetical protein
MLCGLVVLALVASKDVLFYQCIHFGLPVMMRDKLEHSVFAGMLCRRRIVAGLNDLGIELLVIGDVQFPFIVQESVEFFPLEKVIN